jgi:hypothetical protein
MAAESNRSISSRLGRWTAELLLVFLGAYAAFWLNGYQQHQQDAKRRDQILAALEEIVKDGIESSKTEGIKQDQQAAEFRRALNAGEMPAIRPFSFSSDYSASDVASMLQAGGYDLLEVKTLIALRNTESVIRGGLSRVRHYQDLSDQMIVPHLDDDISFFYDPATKQLRKKFARYPEILESSATFFHDMEKAQNELLKQIQSERRRH